MASVQYRSFRRKAAALGCRCLVNTPFLFPTTRVTPADRAEMMSAEATEVRHTNQDPPGGANRGPAGAPAVLLSERPTGLFLWLNDGVLLMSLSFTCGR